MAAQGQDPAAAADRRVIPVSAMSDGGVPVIPWGWAILCWVLGAGVIAVFFMEHRKLLRLAHAGQRQAVRAHPLMAMESSRKGLLLSTLALAPIGLYLLVHVPVVGVFVLIGPFPPLLTLAFYWGSIVESVNATIVEPS
jgi:hypothetical protein